MHKMHIQVKKIVAGYISSLIIATIARLNWPWNRRVSLLVDRLVQIQEAGHE